MPETVQFRSYELLGREDIPDDWPDWMKEYGPERMIRATFGTSTRNGDAAVICMVPPDLYDVPAALVFASLRSELEKIALELANENNDCANSGHVFDGERWKGRDLDEQFERCVSCGYRRYHEDDGESTGLWLRSD